jgi:16S rRNA (guanine966-N2)-methyltransferase
MRQALFDMLIHAEWGGRRVIEGAAVLDVFAGTGALGLEALSRGAASVCFVENDPAALRALRANVAACKAADRTRILAVDALAVSPSLGSIGLPQGLPVTGPDLVMIRGTLVFLDPPYGRDFVPRALARLGQVGWIGSGAIAIAETGRDETWVPDQPLLAERQHGAARVLVFRLA